MTTFFQSFRRVQATAQETAVEGICGKNSSQAISKLNNLVAEIASQVYKNDGTIESQNFIAVDLAMMIKQCSEENRYANPIYSGKVVPFHDEEVFKKALRYAAHATAAYSADKAVICDTVGDLKPDDIIHVEACAAVWAPNYYVCLDKETDEIVLAIRGTAGVADALTTADIQSVPLFGGQVHGGIWQTACTLYEQMTQKIYDLHVETGRKIAVVGHSLGGGIAVLFMIKLFGEQQGLLNGLKAYQTCRCWNFASPPCFGPLVNLPKWVHSTTYSFIHHVDVVPRCSLNNIVKTVLAMKKVDEMDISAMDRLNYIKSEDARLPQHLPDFEELTPELDEHYVALRNIGTLLLLYPSPENGSTTCVQVQPEQLNRVLLHPEMVTSHLMGGYYECLWQMTQTPPPDSIVTKAGKFIAKVSRNSHENEKVDAESIEAALAEEEKAMRTRKKIDAMMMQAPKNNLHN